MPCTECRFVGRSNSPIISEDMTPSLKLPISMKAQDASLPDILKILATRSGMNFVTSEMVSKEKISIILNETPMDEAIDLVVRAAGLSYEIDGNSVLVAEPEKINRAEVGQQGYVVGLRYANARDVAAVLEKITPNIKVDEAGNRLICYTSPRIISEIERMVKCIDKPHLMVIMETRLIQANISKNGNYGIEWQNLSPVVTALTHPNALIPGTNPIIPWTVFSPATGPGASVTSTSTGTSTSSSTTTAGINLALDFMLSNNTAKLLMDSKLTTINNHPATLYIGDVYPYEVQAYNFGGGSSGANVSVQKEETGIKIVLEPHVNENHEVTIAVQPEVSNVVDFVGANKDLPHTQVRKTSSTVRVLDGHTIFLAGLIQEQNSVAITKVPILGSIPLLGLLFQNRATVKTKTNLILEITPHILSDSVSADETGKDMVDSLYKTLDERQPRK